MGKNETKTECQKVEKKKGCQQERINERNRKERQRKLWASHKHTLKMLTYKCSIVRLLSHQHLVFLRHLEILWMFLRHDDNPIANLIVFNFRTDEQNESFLIAENKSHVDIACEHRFFVCGSPWPSSDVCC